MNRVFYIHSTHSQDVVLHRLKENTTIQPVFSRVGYMDMLKKQYKKFYGSFQDNRFTVSLPLLGRNRMTPLIRGEVLPQDGGSILRYKVCISPYVLIACVFIGVINCVAFLFVREGTSPAERLMFSIPVIVASIAFVAVEYWFLCRTIKSVYEDFCKMLE